LFFIYEFGAETELVFKYDNFNYFLMGFLINANILSTYCIKYLSPLIFIFGNLLTVAISIFFQITQGCIKWQFNWIFITAICLFFIGFLILFFDKYKRVKVKISIKLTRL